MAIPSGLAVTTWLMRFGLSVLGLSNPLIIKGLCVIILPIGLLVTNFVSGFSVTSLVSGLWVIIWASDGFFSLPKGPNWAL